MRLMGWLLLAYLAGSVNFAILLLTLLGKGDPRDLFSGNAGTTNVYRQAGRGWAMVVLLLDVGRAAALAAGAIECLPLACVPWVGLALVTGNRFPILHRFRGGKGVASYLGMVLLLSPWGAAAACLLWVIVQQRVGVPFIASFAMVLTLGTAAVCATGLVLSAWVGTGLTILLIILNHWKNIMSFRAAGQLKPPRTREPDHGRTAEREGN